MVLVRWKNWIIPFWIISASVLELQRAHNSAFFAKTNASIAKILKNILGMLNLGSFPLFPCSICNNLLPLRSSCERWLSFPSLPSLLSFQGVHLLRRRDIPLEAVDHHVNQSILTPLMSEDSLLEAVLDLANSDSEYAGDDPQSVLRKLMCATQHVHL